MQDFLFQKISFANFFCGRNCILLICQTSLQTLRKAMAHGSSAAKPSQARFWTRSTLLAGQRAVGGSETWHSCHFIFVLWRETEERQAYWPGQRSAVKITALSFFFFKAKNTNTRQMEINFFISQEPGYFPTALHLQDCKYSCYSSYYSVITGHSVCREKCLFFHPAGL